MTPSEEMYAFYFEIGLAITQWAHVERALLEVIGSGLPDEEFNILGHGLFSIEAFHGKLKFCDAQVSIRHEGSKHLAKWADLVRRLMVASGHRNALAHDRVKVYETNAGRRYALEKWVHRSDLGSQPRTRPHPQKQGNGPAQDAITLRKVVGYRYEFFALNGALMNLSSALRGTEAHFPESIEQPMNSPTIQTLAAQMHEALGHPQQPSKKK